MCQHIPQNRCPYCNHWKEHFTNPYCSQQVQPDGSFISVCNDCCKLAIYDDQLQQTRQPNEIELKQLLTRPDIGAAIHIIKEKNKAANYIKAKSA